MNAYLAALRRSAGIEGAPGLPAAFHGAGFDGDPFAAIEGDMPEKPTDAQVPSTALAMVAPPTATPQVTRSTYEPGRSPEAVTAVGPEPVEGRAPAETKSARAMGVPARPINGAATPAASTAAWPAASPAQAPAASARPLHPTVQAALRWVAADAVAATAATPARHPSEQARPSDTTPARPAVTIELGGTTPATASFAPVPPASSRHVVQHEAASTCAPRSSSTAPSQPLELRIGQIHLHLDAPPAAPAAIAPTLRQPSPARDFSGSAVASTRSSLARARLRRL